MIVSDMSVDTARYSDQGLPRSRRLAVAWQNPESRSIQPVGLLAHAASGYEFRYVRNALTVKGFLPLIGFPDLAGVYSSSRLFPLFAQRVMAPRRPDFSRYVESLDLTEDADPWEQLTRSEGRRAGDTIIVFPEPVIDDDGQTQSNFLVHGIRHAIPENSLDERLRSVRRGDRLTLDPEPSNPVNARAIRAVDQARVPLGWVPDLLLSYVHTVTDTGPYELVVQHVNGPEAPIHLRLLVRLTGRVPVGYRAFAGAAWDPVT